MVSYALKLAGAAAILILAGALAIVIFDEIWVKASLGAAFLIVAGGLLLFAWYVDRKDKQSRQGLEDLPPV